MLGGWWALQEGTWGGWWNWDASEVLGLLILILAYVEVHSNYNYYLESRKQERVILFLLLILLSYYFIQLNFELTSHSFGTRFNHFFNNPNEVEEVLQQGALKAKNVASATLNRVRKNLGYN